MPIEIGTMNTNVEILPEVGKRTTGINESTYTSHPAQDADQLKEVLRPLLMELISEELENYRKMRG